MKRKFERSFFKFSNRNKNKMAILSRRHEPRVSCNLQLHGRSSCLISAQSERMPPNEPNQKEVLYSVGSSRPSTTASAAATATATSECLFILTYFHFFIRKHSRSTFEKKENRASLFGSSSCLLARRLICSFHEEKCFVQ